MNKIITLENLAKAVEYFKGKLNGKADKSEIPASLPANGGNADTVDSKHALEFAAASHTHTASEIGALTNIKIGTVTTGAAGSSAGVTAVTNGTATTLNLTIPKGDTGATGPAGTSYTYTMKLVARSSSGGSIFSTGEASPVLENDSIQPTAAIGTTGLTSTADLVLYRNGTAVCRCGPFQLTGTIENS